MYKYDSVSEDGKMVFYRFNYVYYYFMVDPTDQTLKFYQFSITESNEIEIPNSARFEPAPFTSGLTTAVNMFLIQRYKTLLDSLVKSEKMILADINIFESALEDYKNINKPKTIEPKEVLTAADYKPGDKAKVLDNIDPNSPFRIGDIGQVIEGPDENITLKLVTLENDVGQGWPYQAEHLELVPKNTPITSTK